VVRFPVVLAPLIMRRLLLLLFCLHFVAAGAAERREADLLIAGATESGWAAAIQAARLGVERIVIVHDGRWFGGQYTEQALACVDENKGVGKVGWGPAWHPMKRSFHRSGLFRELMDRIEAFNAEKYGSPMPGRPHHGPSTFRPAEAEVIFREMIRPHLESGQVVVYWDRIPVSADVDDSGERPRLRGVSFGPVDGDGTADLEISAAITIDASDWGEVIQVAGAAYECGPDPRSRYGEPSAPPGDDSFPSNEMNPITWAMIVEETGEESAIPRPPHFDDRNYPRATHFSREAFAGLEWDRKTRLGAIPHWPPEGEESDRQLSVYTVRRIVDGNTSRDGRTSILLNYMNGQDYPLTRLPRRVVDALEANEPGASEKNIVEMTRAQRAIVFQDAKNHALGVLYHMQNFVHERAPDTANSFRYFQLSREFGTPDHLPPKPYIRESLRLRALYMMREQDGRNRDGETKQWARERFSDVLYPDGLFAWQFHYDFHRTGRTYLVDEGDRGPWIDYERPGRHTRFLSDRCVFPARSLVPEEMDGLLGAQKNLGTSSMVSAAIRLHDHGVHVGQASAALAVVVLREEVDPRAVPYRRELLEAVRGALCGETGGMPLLLWPWRDLPADHPDFVAVNRLSALGCLPIEATGVDFRPDEEATEDWRERVETCVAEQFSGAANLVPSRAAGVTRGEIARAVWSRIEESEAVLSAFPRHVPGDADDDGIPDRDDALLFTPNDPITWQVRRPDLTESTDGLPPLTSSPVEMWFDFGGGKGNPDAIRDSGRIWSDERGVGWRRDIASNHRRRSVYPEAERDTFLFTRTEDTWEVEVRSGTWEVVVCVGDSGHDQPGQWVKVEGETVIAGEGTLAGMFLERMARVEVTDGRLTVTIGGDGAGRANTCLCWLLLRPL